MVIKTKDTLYLVKVKLNYLASYKGTYSNEQSLNFVIPIMVILFLGIIYKMTKEQKPVYNAREQETKNWVYDLIKGEGDFVFVAEVPGPEDKIAVRLIDGILYIRGSVGFSKEVPIEGSNEMKIVDFKYRNGVLTLRIK